MAKKQVFTNEEKQKLIELYQTGQYSREELAQFVPGRTGRQCRNFILNNRILSGTRIFWTEEEDKLLKELCESKKYTYAKMVKFFKNRDRKSIVHRADKLKLSNETVTNAIYSYNENYFDEITVENCYWAGFFAADGCVYKHGNNMAFQWTITEKDSDHMKLFCSIIQSNYPIKIQPQKSPSYPYRINNQYIFSTKRANRWAEKLKEHFGIIPKKTKRFPPPNLNNNKEKLSYLAGLIDGDGSIVFSNDSLSISICSCNKELLIWIKDFIEELNLPTLRNLGYPQISIPKYENCYYYSISGFRAFILHELIMRINVTYLKRKWDNPIVIDKKKIYKESSKWPNEIFFQNILNG